LDETLYVALFTSVASSLLALAVFKDSRGKIARYGGVINGIKELVSKWNSFSDIERASQENIHWLVRTGELLVASEHTAWKSTPKIGKNKEADASKSEEKTTSKKAS